MSEVLVEYPEFVIGENSRAYLARACAKQVAHNAWHGWIEFEPAGGGTPIRSPRETTQPNRRDIEYWATGLTTVYLEGALRRALNPYTPKPAPPPREPYFDGPADEERPTTVPAPEAILDPFSVYLKGETLLRRQLLALSAWHLVNIVRAYEISTGARDPNAMTTPELIEAIVSAARTRTAAGIPE